LWYLETETPTAGYAIITGMKRRLVFWTPPALALGLVVATSVVLQIWEHHRLTERLKDSDPALRAAALRRLNEEKLFIEALRDEDADVRCIAAERLGEAGSGPKQAERVKALIPLFLDDHAYVRRQAAFSLAYIGPDASWPALEEALQGENPRLRSGVARALPDVCWGKNGWIREPMLSRLDKLLTDEDAEVRSSAEYAIKRFRR
jgi:HEAT repeat protein